MVHKPVHGRGSVKIYRRRRPRSQEIANEFRNMGYGKEIIKLLMKKHSKFEFIAVVKSLNKASLSIFESLGFIKTGQKEDLIYFEYNTNKE